jgi:four helix bundle protein
MHNLRELDVWKISSELARDAYRLTMSRPLKSHFELADQIRRSATSIPANLAEGYGLGTRAQFIRCARIALGSAYELRAHLELAADLHLGNSEQLSQTLQKSVRAVGLLIGTLRGLRAQVPCSGRTKGDT